MFLKVKPIQRSQIVAEQLIAKIRQDKMQIGDKLPPEREIARAMDVGRNTLREAIATLQLMGLLEVRRSSGIFVAALPPETGVSQDMQHILTQNMDPQTAIDARIAMEPGAAILASQMAKEEDWALLERIFMALRRAVDDNNAQLYRKADNSFHKAIVRITRNDALTSALFPILDSVRQPLWRTMKLNIYDAKMLHRSYEEHRRIYEALLSRDEYFIFRAVRAHLERSKARLAAEQAANGDSTTEK